MSSLSFFPVDDVNRARGLMSNANDAPRLLLWPRPLTRRSAGMLGSTCDVSECASPLLLGDVRHDEAEIAGAGVVDAWIVSLAKNAVAQCEPDTTVST
jgi:hypothetical protein